jgi:hypothetical protein
MGMEQMQKYSHISKRSLTLILVAGSLFATGLQVHGQPAGDDFFSIVPRSWSLEAPEAQSNERRFVAPDRTAWLSVYATAARSTAPRADLDAIKEVPGGRITYEREERDWIVVSGFRGDRIFYRKAMLACDNRRWHHIDFEYPASRKKAFDRFVTRVSYALADYARVGCG